LNKDHHNSSIGHILDWLLHQYVCLTIAAIRGSVSQTNRWHHL